MLEAPTHLPHFFMVRHDFFTGVGLTVCSRVSFGVVPKQKNDELNCLCCAVSMDVCDASSSRRALSHLGAILNVGFPYTIMPA